MKKDVQMEVKNVQLEVPNKCVNTDIFFMKNSSDLTGLPAFNRVRVSQYCPHVQYECV